ncbi:MAG TPA: trypsin-like peptidase domain-containing protein [Longimicrobium sp.]|nr:trypsin-like peptidase domain-containing protein [Longimicrobium sp.]
MIQQGVRTVAAALAVAVGVGIGFGAAMGVGGRATPPAWAQGQTPAKGQTPIQGRIPTQGREEPQEGEESSIVRVARQVTPAVVSVTADEGAGSGVIIRADGVILTNAHVVGQSRQVEIGLANGETLPGRVLGRDPSIDIAIVDVEGNDLPVAPLGNSDQLEVGQTAIAIGNPLALERTVTRGIVSAVNRTSSEFQLDELIQTDAAINPGNSGGPLLDSRGQVVGINTAVLRGTDGIGAEGLGFAVPINLASDVADQILTTGRVTRAFVGVNYLDVTPEMAQEFGLPVQSGIILRAVGPRTPAGTAGLRPGDIITRWNNTPIESGGDFRKAIRDSEPGSTITLSGVRPEGPFTVRLRLIEAPAEPMSVPLPGGPP